MHRMKGTAMTLTLTHDTEIALRALAARHGQDPETVLKTLVTRAAAEEEQERQDTANGIRAGMEDFAAGRWVSLEDMEAESHAARSTPKQTPA
jgi:predicted transcriptional regulator